MNRRANLPMTLLFFVCLFLLTLALFSFATFKKTQDQTLSDSSMLTSQLEFKEQYVRATARSLFTEALVHPSSDVSAQLQSVAVRRDLGLVGIGNLFAKIRDKDFTLEDKGDRWVLTLKDVFVTSQVGQHRLTRTFTIILESRKGL